MAENKLRIQRKEDEVYRINISDDGQESVFDLLDINLAYKVNKAFQDVEKNYSVCEGNILAIKNKYKNQKETKVGMLTKEEIEISNEYKKMYEKNRVAMDSLLGKGTMHAMYDDLFTALEPHLSNIEINVDSVKDRLMKKYGKKKNKKDDGILRA